ncbi:MAG: efflux RND transporter periplasmic adaptor subunit [Parachlamydiales bacterium]
MRRRLIIIAAVLLVIGGIGFALYWFLRPRPPENFLVVYGNIDVHQVDIAFRVSGRVTQMPFQEGDLVKPGDWMGSLDDQPYADQVRQSTGGVRAASANAAYAEQVWERREALWSLGDGSISEEDYQQALANRNAQRAALKEAIAALGVAETNLRETQVYSPSEGTILTRVREPGSVVREADPIYTLSLLSPVWVRAFIPEPYLGKVRPGMEAQILTDTPGGRVYTGQVGFISPVAEFTPKTVQTTQLRTDLVYRIRVIADNPDGGLRQGMPVTVKLFFDSDGRDTGQN